MLSPHGYPDYMCRNGLAKARYHVPIPIHEYGAYMLGKQGMEIARSFGFKNSSEDAGCFLHDGVGEDRRTGAEGDAHTRSY